jgi:hypothetical protein
MALTHRVGWDANFCDRSPWFWPLTAAAARFRTRADWPLLADFDALHAERAAANGCEPLRFCANVRKQDKREGGRVVLSALYDARISLAFEVPTRERDWHDFLNALCFATFPRSKRALHARQYRVLAARIEPDATRLPGARTKEQDALTLFDEGGVVLAADPDAAQQLLAVLGAERAALYLQLTAARRTRLVPFGHALFEHLVEGLRVPGGCTQVVAAHDLWGDQAGLLERVDVALAHMLNDPERFVSPRDCSHVRLDTLELARMF